MSGHCKACDVTLFDDELTAKYPGTNEYIELCFRCLDIALDPDSAPDFYENKPNDHYEE